MKFVAPTFLMKKKDEYIKNFENASNFVKGLEDKEKKMQLNYHKNFKKNDGIKIDSVVNSINIFKEKLNKIDKKLSETKFIISNKLTIVDIAWFVYLRRLETIGFSFENEYPFLNKWFKKLKKNKNFLKETSLPLPLKIISSFYKIYLSLTNQSIRSFLNKK